MPVSGPDKPKRNFKPDSFETPNYRKDKDGKYDPTTYQGAMGLRKFLHDNDMPFVSRIQATEAVNKGTITRDDNSVINLSDPEKAMFRRVMNQGLFNRLDAGTTNTQDGWIGVQDINDATKQTWKLHGAERSPTGKWADPGTNPGMTDDEAGQLVLDGMQKHGINYIQHNGIEAIANNQNHRTKDGSTVDADPRFIQALLKVGKEFDDINSDNNHYLDADELNNWLAKA